MIARGRAETCLPRSGFFVAWSRFLREEVPAVDRYAVRVTKPAESSKQPLILIGVF